MYIYSFQKTILEYVTVQININLYLLEQETFYLKCYYLKINTHLTK